MREILEFFEDKVQYGDYSQFTTDFIQDRFNDLLEMDIPEEDMKKSLSYEVDNILEVLKEGKDKEFFKNLKKNL